jgi:predicted amidohydrolase
MRVALHQCSSPAGDVTAAFAEIQRGLAIAAAGGADVCVFPELMLPGYNQPELIPKMAQTVGGAWEQTCCDLARTAGCGLILGWAERDGNTLWNASSFYDAQGRKQAHYRKQHLYGPQEKALFTPAQGDCIFTLAGRCCALLICFDVEFNERVTKLAAQGVDVIFVPTANPAFDRDVSDITVRARARDNCVTIVYANFCGYEDGLEYAGTSVVAGPDGALHLRLGDQPATVIVDLPAPVSIKSD